ncbi:glycosyltransferase [uncultured Ramlibacter sp.]|uniref:glycosyltransferase n=1 Tax=uncultured Ramlibacter sp. TaxID=260755 RepID=UPI0026032B0D|nr:glycosyltransferase [uncultured Ramlibacter sp.]
MRILQLGRFWDDQHGGIERHAALLSRGLAASGAEVINLVAAAGRSGSDGPHDGYRLIQAPSLGKLAGTAMSPVLVLRALALHRERPFDIIHLHLPDPLSHLLSMLLPAGPKRVLTWHSDIVRQKGMLRLYAPWLRQLAGRADAIVAATQAHFDSSSQIPDTVPRERLHVIPYGLDYAPLELTAGTAALARELRGRANGRTMVFALGRHVYYKGFDVLIEAMRQVDGFLVLGGDGPLRPVLEARAKECAVSDRVWFSGRIPEAELGAYFHACDVFCLPAVERSEAFGLVQLEAMACGKPVVNTWLYNGVNEVSRDGETGLTVPVRDAPALSAALSRLATNTPLRDRLGQAARQRALRDYSLDEMTRRHLALYRELLSTRR